MNLITHFRCKIILFIFTFLLIWQIFRFLPWLQFQQNSNIEYNPTSSRLRESVLVTVYYEALCPDSKNFIIKHLLSTIIKAPNLVNVSLIPYGKAKTEEDSNGGLSFSCQHGPLECLANKIHACAISKIPDSILLIKYISCMISDNMIPELIGEKCAKDLMIEWNPILQCANSEKGNLLLNDFGKLTNSLRPRISFVPTVLLNNKHRNQATILKSFFKEVCSILQDLPKECMLPL